MKPSDDPKVAASAGSTGSIPAERANAITTGTTMFADAVLLVVSESAAASAVERAINPSSERTPRRLVSAEPSASASPVLNASVPSAIPPPYRNTIHQSIFSASLQGRVNSCRRRFVGRTNRSPAPNRATTDSGRSVESATYSGASWPAISATIPGSTQRNTVAANANRAFFSPRDQGPSFARSPPSSSVTPLSRLPAGAPERPRSNSIQPISSAQSGTPSAIHEKNGRSRPSSRRMKPSPIRFGGVPTRVPIPPIDAPNELASKSAVAKAAGSGGAPRPGSQPGGSRA